MHPELFHGEELAVAERVIIAPAAGQFRPTAPEAADGSPGVVARGETIGFVDLPGEARPVPSPFGGRLMGLLAHPGERVREGQPLAWLRVA